MKIGKLYIKIFLSFMMVLIITMILNYWLQEITVRRYFRENYESYTHKRVTLLKELIEKKYWSEDSKSLKNNLSIGGLINHIGELQWAEVWICDSRGQNVLKSFSGDTPSGINGIEPDNCKDFDAVSVYYDFNGHRDIYAVTPLDIDSEENYTLHIIFRGFEGSGFNMARTLGNIGIGIIIALLIIPVSRFITERLKQLRQSALRIAKGDLSHRIDIHSSDEIGELSVAFNQMADEVQRMIMGGKELTAHVSHELRTPLTRIRIAEEILNEKLDNRGLEDFKRHLADIREDVEVLDRLIGRILELSKIDMHEPRFKMETLDFEAMIEELLGQLDPIIERKGLSVHTDLFSTSCEGHGKSLATALLNVLDNAVKYTVEKGEIYVNMQTVPNSLKISVINSCGEMDEKDLTGMFEPFHRLNNSDTSGSGLGLSITHKIIDRHGGKIEAFNTKKGLEIRITLPLETGQNRNGQKINLNS